MLLEYTLQVPQAGDRPGGFTCLCSFQSHPWASESQMCTALGLPASPWSSRAMGHGCARTWTHTQTYVHRDSHPQENLCTWAPTHVNTHIHGQACTWVLLHTGIHAHRHPCAQASTHMDTNTHPQQHPHKKTPTNTDTDTQRHTCTRRPMHMGYCTLPLTHTDTHPPQQHSLPHVPVPTVTHCGSQCHPYHTALPSPSTEQSRVALRTPFIGPTARAMGDH